MDEHHKDHQIGGPSVNRPDQPAELHLRHQKLDGLIACARRWGDDGAKKNAGSDLNHKEKQRHSTEIIPKRVPVNRHLFLFSDVFRFSSARFFHRASSTIYRALGSDLPCLAPFAHNDLIASDIHGVLFQGLRRRPLNILAVQNRNGRYGRRTKFD